LGNELGFGAFDGSVGGEAGGGLVGIGGDGALLAMTDHEEGDRHKGDDGEQNQRDDEGDARMMRDAWGVMRDAWGVMRDAWCVMRDA
jgi:hypothetical protein